MSMAKDKHLKVFLVSFLVLALGMVSFVSTSEASSVSVDSNANSTRVSAPKITPNAYDLSQWQGNISNRQAAGLKNEVNFVILKAENGGLMTDPSFDSSSKSLQNNHIPYGAYDYSLYANQDQAKAEADTLYQRAPNASFYVNDAEENNVGDSNDFNASTQAWANEMHQMTNKPVVLYSGLYFMNHNMTPATRNAYNALWLADYGAEPDPAYHYDLWQYTDDHYSKALNQKVDASILPEGNNKPLSFWAGNGNNNPVIVEPKKPQQPKHHKKVVPKVKPQPKPRKHRNRRIVYNPNYYTSKRIDYLQVISRGGISLYLTNGKYIGKVPRGMILMVNRFKTYHYRHLGYMTRAIGTHLGLPDVFTTNKKYVRWYRY